MTITDVGLNSDQLLLGTARGPGLWLADTGTPPPQSLDEPFSGWDSLGYASEDGPTISTSTDTTDIRGWQSLGVLRTVTTGRTVTAAFQLLQWNPLNLALYWDVDRPEVEADGSFTKSVRSEESGRRYGLGIDVQDGENQVRYIFPRVQLQSAGDMTFQRGSLTVLDVTFAVLETEGVLAGIMGRFPGSTPAEESRYSWWPVQPRELPAAQRGPGGTSASSGSTPPAGDD